MYHMLIVDDEKVERDCIRFLAESFSLSLVIEEADNGEDALAILRSHPVDILCTDVQMPVMDGLKLAEEAGKLNPHMHVIIFSGHAEFEYARTAVTLGVANYILKPVNPEELCNTLTSVIAQIDQAKASHQVRQKQQSYLVQYALQQAINGNTGLAAGPDVQQELASFHRMLLLEFQSNFLETHYQLLFDGLRRDLGFDMESLNLSPTQALLLLRRNPLSPQEAPPSSHVLGQQLYEYLLSHFSSNVYLAVGEVIEPRTDQLFMDALHQAYLELEHLMELRFWAPARHVFTSDSPDSRTTEEEDMEDDTRLGQIRQALAARDATLLTKTLEAIFDKYSKPCNQSQIYVKFIFSNLITTLYPAHAALVTEGEPGLDALVTELYTQPDVNRIIHNIRNMSERIAADFERSTAEIRKEVAMVQEYISKNYHKELSAETLASIVYLTPDYLSRLFKKTTQKSLSQYIRQFRMEKASELLLHTTQKVIDIGVSVGYPNYSYFCQSFREYYGISPEKYRQEGHH